jgi:DNA-directed RNA polymerase subunit RPC12/RpoP
VIRYRCAGCGFVLAIVRVERSSKGRLHKLVVQLYNGRTFRGCVGALTPQELAAMVEKCPRCGRSLSKSPVKVEVKPARGV